MCRAQRAPIGGAIAPRLLTPQIQMAGPWERRERTRGEPLAKIGRVSPDISVRGTRHLQATDVGQNGTAFFEKWGSGPASGKRPSIIERIHHEKGEDVRSGESPNLHYAALCANRCFCVIFSCFRVFVDAPDLLWRPARGRVEKVCGLAVRARGSGRYAPSLRSRGGGYAQARDAEYPGRGTTLASEPGSSSSTR